MSTIPTLYALVIPYSRTATVVHPDAVPILHNKPPSQQRFHLLLETYHPGMYVDEVRLYDYVKPKDVLNMSWPLVGTLICTDKLKQVVISCFQDALRSVDVFAYSKGEKLKYNMLEVPRLDWETLADPTETHFATGYKDQRLLGPSKRPKIMYVLKLCAAGAKRPNLREMEGPYNKLRTYIQVVPQSESIPPLFTTSIGKGTIICTEKFKIADEEAACTGFEFRKLTATAEQLAGEEFLLPVTTTLIS